MSTRSQALVPILALAVVLSAFATAPALTVTRLADDFAGPVAHSQWATGTEGSGSSRIAGPDACLVIESGTMNGTRTWVESVRTFDTSSGFEQFLDMRCRVTTAPLGPADMAFWGLYHQAGGQEYSIGYWVKWGPMGASLEARVRSGGQTVGLPVPGVNPLELHDYGLEILENRARFVVDGEVVWEHSGWETPQGLLHVRFQKTSPGRNKTLLVESVALAEDLGSTTDRLDWDDRAAGAVPGGAASGPQGIGRGAAVTPDSWARVKAAWRD